ncbi:hypothetical protein [Polaribacter sp.]|uniref:hypothetical protein n=1 Tax=Polaribacter sp. TaxID=1920175 RepID=UPI003F69CADE
MKIIRLLLLVICFPIYSQGNKIIKLKLKDSILKKTITDYIISKENDSSEFKRIGYIALRQIYLNEEAINNDLKSKFDITDQYYRPTNDLPSFYTYIEERLVLIYDHSVISKNTPYSKKKQRKINRLVKPYLNKTIRLKIRDDNGKLIVKDRHFRDEKITLHGGILLSIYENGKVIIDSGYR